MTAGVAQARAAIERLRARIGRRRMRTIDIGFRAGFVVAMILFAVYRPVAAVDAHAYWAVDLSNPYSRPIAAGGG